MRLVILIKSYLQHLKNRSVPKALLNVLYVLAVLLIALIVLNTQRKNIFQSNQLLSSETCTRACWEDIEPGVTTQSTVREMLSDKGIEYSVSTSGGVFDDGGIYTWPLESTSSEEDVSVFFTDGVVVQIILPMNMCLSRVINDIGIPDEATTANGIVSLVYFDKGLSFGGDFNTLKTSIVFLFDKTIRENFKLGTLKQDWDQIAELISSPCADELSGTQADLPSTD
jgi:hypothetical protein